MKRVTGKMVCILLMAFSAVLAVWSEQQRRSEKATRQFLEAHLVEVAVSSAGSVAMLRDNHPEKAEEYLVKDVRQVYAHLKSGKIRPTSINAEKWGVFAEMVEASNLQNPQPEHGKGSETSRSIPRSE